MLFGACFHTELCRATCNLHDSGFVCQCLSSEVSRLNGPPRATLNCRRAPKRIHPPTTIWSDMIVCLGTMRYEQDATHWTLTADCILWPWNNEIGIRLAFQAQSSSSSRQMMTERHNNNKDFRRHFPWNLKLACLCYWRRTILTDFVNRKTIFYVGYSDATILSKPLGRSLPLTD